MSKWISCLVTARKVVLVECEDDDENPEGTAINIAGLEAFDGTFDEVAWEGGYLTGVALERARRHADIVHHL